MKKYSILMSGIIFLLIIAGCGGSSSTGLTESQDDIKASLLQNMAPVSSDVINDIYLNSDETIATDTSEITNNAPRKADGIDTKQTIYFALKEKSSSYINGETGNITYDFIYQILEVADYEISYGIVPEPTVLKDMSGEIVYKYIWNGSTWERAPSTKLEKNPVLTEKVNSCIVKGVVKNSITGLPVENCKVIVSNPEYSNPAFYTNSKGAFIARVFGESRTETTTYHYTIISPEEMDDYYLNDKYKPVYGTVEVDLYRKKTANLGTVLLEPEMANYQYTTITGTVTDGTDPIEGALVYLRFYGSTVPGEVLNSYGSVRTDASGNFTMKYIPNGTYYLCVDAEGFQTLYTSVSTFDPVNTVASNKLKMSSDAIIMTISDLTTSGCKVSWEPLSNAGYGYDLFVDDTQIYSANQSASTLSKTISGLVTGRVYTIRLEAKTGASSFDKVISTTFVQIPKAKVNHTVMVYMMADNNLSVYGTGNSKLEGDINELEKLANSANVNILVEIDSVGNKGGRRYVIQHDEEDFTITSPVVSFPEPDSTSREHLLNFLKWGIESYPSDYLHVVLWNHGSGLSIGSDNSNKKGTLSLEDLNYVFTQAKAVRGNVIDSLVYQACLMQNVESALELEGLVTYHIASQESMYGTAIDHYMLWDRLVKYSTSYGAPYVSQVFTNPDYYTPDYYVRTISSLDLSSTKITGFSNVMKAMVSEFSVEHESIKHVVRYRSQILTAYSKAKKFANNQVDLLSFVNELLNALPNDSICDDLVLKIMDVRDYLSMNTIIFENNVLSPTYDAANGLSIFLPNPKAVTIKSYYSYYTTFHSDSLTNWSEFLKEIYNSWKAPAYQI